MAAAERSSETPPAGPPPWLELRGHGGPIAAWRELVAAGSLPPVMLLTGRAGIGKRGLLGALAALHVCATGSACGTCEPCRWLLAGRHPEVLWIESEAGKLLIDDAASLQEHLELSPTPPARWRLAVVVDADQLLPQAANRLLKTLEEPPARARILMSSSRAGAMLPTVLSRCVRWRVQPPALADSLALLAERFAAAGRPLPDDAAATELLRRSGLAPGTALRLAGLLGEDGGEVPDLAPLLAARTPGQVVMEAERLGRQGGWPVTALLAQLDMELNRSYREALDRPAALPRPSVAAARRDLLRQARRLARGGNVPLNAQLTLEALAFAGHWKTEL